ncbi:MAG: glycosyltransferase family 2 protein [Candidatus Dadabacteria bacterium]|nr:MAG: glycosyltransferase family 2 protein [Candidatus Dadabacteria bacterium]
MNRPKRSGRYINQWVKERSEHPEQALELSVIIPAFNEAKRIPSTLLDITTFAKKHNLNLEIIVVDDGSSDETVEVVNEFARFAPEVRVISLPENKGKGCAVKTGMQSASGSLVMFADADGSTPFKEVIRLKTAIDNGADLAIGSRALFSEDTEVKTAWYRKYLGRMFNLCVNMLVLPGIADTQCGFKLFKKDVARILFEHQTSDGFSFDVEILYLARKAGFKIAEIPVNWENVPGSKVNLLLDAFKMFLDIVKFKFIHRNVSAPAGTGGK